LSCGKRNHTVILGDIDEGKRKREKGEIGRIRQHDSKWGNGNTHALLCAPHPLVAALGWTPPAVFESEYEES